MRTYWTKSPSAAVPQFCLYEKPALATRFGLADTGALVPNVSSLKGELISGVTTNRVGITLDLSNSYLEKTNFTAECFFKTTRQIRADETWTLFRSPCAKLGLGNDHKILARGFKKYNTYADAVVDVRSTMNVDDQKWHHVAYAYCVTNGTFTLYVDGVKQGETKTALLDTTGTNLPSFGWQNGFGADQFFPGWIDEARVTLRTLGPDELMMADPAGRVGTLAQITFDAADAAVGPYPTFTPAGTCLARAGGAVPTFSDSVLPAIDLDGVTRLTTKENVKSLALAGGQVRFADMSTLRGHNDFTVEWFMKVASVDTSTSILRLNCTTSAYEGSVSDFDKAWQVYVYDSTHLRVAATAASGHKDTPNFTAFPSAVADNRWHHYAVTFATVKVNGTTKTEIRLYRDYVAYGMQQFTGVIYYKEDDGCTFTIGANGNMTGLVDEIRVTAGVLPVNSFMRKHPGGIVVLVR